MTGNSIIDLDRYNSDYILSFLNSYEGLILDASDMADGWLDMEEQEQVLQRTALMPYWEKRTILGELYRAGYLTQDQTDRLETLDKLLLEHAAEVELAYGPSLGELLRYLFTSGTPLSVYDGTVRIEATPSALAELAGIPTNA